METYEAQTAVLNDIIKAQPGAHGPLPPLVTDTSAWDEFWHKVGEWIMKFLRGLNLNIDTGGLANFVRPLIYVLLAVLVFALIYSIVKSYSGHRGVKQGGRDLNELRKKSPSEKLAAELDHALALGDFALAGRLRWKIFLLRNREHETSTPLEIFGVEKAIIVSPFYELMFGFKTDLGLYKNFDETLNSRERAP